MSISEDQAIKTIQANLFQNQDITFRDFQFKLIPSSKTATKMIGVRTPILRSYAKELAKTELAEVYINILPHEYYEEFNLHAFILETIKDYDKLISYLDKFLPFIDNWATCDLLSPKIFKKNKDKLKLKILEWIESPEVFTKRFAINMIMSHFLDEDFSLNFMNKVSTIKSDEYYLNMVIAWYFATALSKQYDAALPFITQRKLEPWTHNKTIQKAVESRKIDDATKEYLKTLKI